MKRFGELIELALYKNTYLFIIPCPITLHDASFIRAFVSLYIAWSDFLVPTIFFKETACCSSPVSVLIVADVYFTL